MNICASWNSASVLILLSLGFERASKIHDFQSVYDFCNSIGTEQTKWSCFELVRSTPDSGPMSSDVCFLAVFVCSCRLSGLCGQQAQTPGRVVVFGQLEVLSMEITV